MDERAFVRTTLILVFPFISVVRDDNLVLAGTLENACFSSTLLPPDLFTTLNSGEFLYWSAGNE